MAKKRKIEINPEFKAALDLLENTSQNLLLTGKAGTGKSTLLGLFKRTTRKKAVFLAPTGVAAINVGGQTIHSFFGFKPDITLRKVKKLKPGESYARIYKKLDTIVIDEISMVRCDLLDCVDKFMRLNGKSRQLPFGGAQVVFIGDLYQIPPVVTGRDRLIFSSQYDTPFFFSSNVFKDPDFSLEYIELEKVYRQKDKAFIGLLNAVRNNSATEEDMAALNRRLDPDFVPPDKEFYINLVATNALADAINEREIGKLSGPDWRNSALVKGKFERSSFPAPLDLHLRVGAQVMLLNNDQEGRWVNGTVGKVLDFLCEEEDEVDGVAVELENGEQVVVYPNKWDMFEYRLEDGGISSDTVGSFVQYPIRPAFAITIHKSQGKTFHKVVLDLERGTFAHGQLYVALSRCSSFEGLVLRHPVKKGHIRMDWNVVRFVTAFQYKKAAEVQPPEERLKIIRQGIKEKRALKIVYLKGKDEKSERDIIPFKISAMEFRGHPFTGLSAHCLARGADRVFNIERILRVSLK